MADLQNQFSGWRFHATHWADALRRQWHWLLLGLTVFAIGGFFCGYAAGFYTATVELFDCSFPGSPSAPEKNDATNDRTRPDLVAGVARSDFVMRRVAEASESAVTPNSLAALTGVSVTPAAGLIAIQVKGRNANQTVRLANVFGEQVAAAAQALLDDRHTARRLEIDRNLASVDEDLGRASREVTEFQRRTTGMEFEGEWAAPIRRTIDLDRKAEDLSSQLEVCDLQIRSLTKEISRLTPALLAAKEALTQALMRYTEAHPTVIELRAAVASLETQSAAPGAREDPGIGMLNSPAAVGLYTRLTELRGQRAGLMLSLDAVISQRHQLQAQVKSLPEDQADYVRLKSRFEALKEQRFVLARRVEEAQLLQEADTGRVQVVERATHKCLGRSHKWRMGLWFGMGSAVVGFLVTALLVIVFLAGAGRIRSEQQLLHATRLPLLATLGDLSNLTDEERRQWAFRTFTRVRAKLTRSNEDAVICGFTSATHAEGRSTWISLLADAAGRLGYRVVTITAVTSESEATMQQLEVPETQPGREDEAIASPQRTQYEVTSLPATWAWSPEYREQWGQAVQEWQTVKRFVVFVELPPASLPEAVLLAEGLPNLIWLCNKDTARISETCLHLDTLRQARTNLVGCVLNRTASKRRKRRLAVWRILLGLLALEAPAQETNQIAAKVAVTDGLSVSAPDRLAEWQKRLTLGPGDVFNVSLYEQPDSLRTGISIGPDGRINYLEARDVLATELTIDELRAKLEEILAKFHRAPRVIINPTDYNSKKYYIQGHVNQRGVFSLDRPTSIIEAIAKARGFVTAFQQRNAWVQADLSRSFLMRRGTDGTFSRVPVDFEGLFSRGDLGQNFSLEPDDYVFFPPLDLQEVYVLGEVRGPGVLPYSPDVTAFGAIIARGGFTPRAFKSRVLVVRGSLNHPQTFVLNAADILTGKGLDFPLNNRDIVYVHRRPWAKAQELLELAVTDFIRAFVVAYAGQHIGPFIKEPLIK